MYNKTSVSGDKGGFLGSTTDAQSAAAPTSCLLWPGMVDDGWMMLQVNDQDQSSSFNVLVFWQE